LDWFESVQSVKPRPPAWQVCSWLFGCTIPKTLSRKGRQARQEGWTAQVLLCDLRVHASGHAGGLVNLTSLGVRPAVRSRRSRRDRPTCPPSVQSVKSVAGCSGFPIPAGWASPPYLPHFVPFVCFVVWLFRCSGCSIPAVSARPPYLFDAQSVSIRVYLWLAVRLFQRYG